MESSKTNKEMMIEYEESLAQAVVRYKKASAKLEFAFDSYDEENIKEEMALHRTEVKSWRAKIDGIKEAMADSETIA